MPDGKTSTDLPGAPPAKGAAAADEAAALKKALQRRERQLGALIANLPGAVYRCTARSPWTMSYISQGVERLTGYPPEDFLSGRRPWAYIVHPDDLPELVHTVETCVAAHRDFAADYRIVTGLGENRWVQERGMAVRDKSGEPLFLEGFMLDITRQKEVEQHLRESREQLAELADAMPALIAFVDSDERYRFANQTYRRWAGLEPQAMAGQKVRDVLGEQVYAAIRPFVEAALGGATVEYEDFVAAAQLGASAAGGTDRHFDVTFVPRISADGLVEGFYSLAVDVTRRKRAEDAQQLLVAELQHRTRNLLAVVRSIAAKTLQDGSSLESFAREFDERLTVLSRVQSLLSQAGENVTMADLVAGELAAHGVVARRDRVTVTGPEVKLPSSVVQVLSLALHELATNALKYGALAQEQAILSVDWDVFTADGTRWLVVRWIEEGVMLPPEPPTRRGFGRQLVEQALPYELAAATDFGFADDGVRCEIRLPLPATSD